MIERATYPHNLPLNQDRQSLEWCGERELWVMNNEHEESEAEKGRDCSWRTSIWAAIRGGWVLGLGWLLVVAFVIWLLSKVGVLK